MTREQAAENFRKMPRLSKEEKLMLRWAEERHERKAAGNRKKVSK